LKLAICTSRLPDFAPDKQGWVRTAFRHRKEAIDFWHRRPSRGWRHFTQSASPAVAIVQLVKPSIGRHTASSALK
jgi:hypothetical protein